MKLVTDDDLTPPAEDEECVRVHVLCAQGTATQWAEFVIVVVCIVALAFGLGLWIGGS